MQFDITTRHFALGEDQRTTIEAALEKLERLSKAIAGTKH